MAFKLDAQRKNEPDIDPDLESLLKPIKEASKDYYYWCYNNNYSNYNIISTVQLTGNLTLALMRLASNKCEVCKCYGRR